MTPRTYRRRPATVEAVQWTGENEQEVGSFLEGWGKVRGFYPGDTSSLHVVGPMGWGWFLTVGDWLVRRAGTVDRVHDDEFEATYEPVEDGPA